MRQFVREWQCVTRFLRVGFALGAVAGVAGCGATSERWSNSEFLMQPASAPSKAANEKPRQLVRQASSEPSRIALASARPGDISGGYLQVARVELPTVQDQARKNQSSPAPVRTADGYGAGNHAPVTDGVYTGPRVSAPENRHDEPQDDDHDHDGALGRDFKPRLPYPRYSRPQVYDRIPDPALEGDDDHRRWRDRGPEESDIHHDDRRPVDDFRHEDSRPVDEFHSYAPRPYDPAPYVPEENRPFYRNPARDLPAKRDERAIGEQTNIKRPGASVASERGAGKVVTVAPGETVYDLAERYGVPVRDILNSNGLYGQRLRPGQDVLIPSRPGESFASVTPASVKPAPSTCVEPRCHLVQKGETLPVLAKRYKVAEDLIASANGLDDGKVTVGQAIVIPARTEVATRAPAPAQTARKADPAPIGETPVRTEPAAAPAEPVQGKPASEQSCDAALTNPLPRTAKTFRKPVEGLIITQFGPQRDGKVNDGVSISVPKGTPIKAAENGVVAYVGEELEGFGKLILIRHADDYVTAYAHADEILVKRCDIVKRGDVIAKAGATGDVSQPQVHFEIRKSQKAIDPVPLLSS